MYTDEDFAINEFVLNFLIFLLTVKILIGVTVRGSFKNIRKRCKPHYSKVVQAIKLSFVYSLFTVHMQNQL